MDYKSICLTLLVLLAFAVLTWVGIRESGYVALGIFTLHICTLVTIVMMGIVYIAHDPSVLLANFTAPADQPWLVSVFLGFS